MHIVAAVDAITSDLTASGARARVDDGQPHTARGRICQTIQPHGSVPPKRIRTTCRARVVKSTVERPGRDFPDPDISTPACSRSTAKEARHRQKFESAIALQPTSETISALSEIPTGSFANAGLRQLPLFHSQKVKNRKAGEHQKTAVVA